MAPTTMRTRSQHQTAQSRNTLCDVLKQGTHILREHSPTPELDARVLLQHAMNMPHAWIIAHDNETIPANLQTAYISLLRRRAAYEPVAYIIGEKEFYGRSFFVNRHVLIPRPETELLIDLTKQIAAMRQHPAIRIADVGTGSGCIGITLAKEISYAFVSATDTSKHALSVAQINSRRLEAEDFLFWHHTSLLESPRGPFDVVVANLPYVSAAQLPHTPRSVHQYEPLSALVPEAELPHLKESYTHNRYTQSPPSFYTTTEFSPQTAEQQTTTQSLPTIKHQQSRLHMDGLSAYADLFKQLPEKLVPGGVVLLEAAPQQMNALTAMARHTFPGSHIRIQKDLAQLDRVLVCAT